MRPKSRSDLEIGVRDLKKVARWLSGMEKRGVALLRKVGWVLEDGRRLYKWVEC